MYHYIAMIWEASDAHAAAIARNLRETFNSRAPSWASIVDQKGLAVFADCKNSGCETAIQLGLDGGVILGNLFPTTQSTWHPGWSPKFDAQTAEEFVSTRGRTLVENFWGGYVAIMRSTAHDTRFVIRDCSGRLQCYYTQHEGITFVFSDVNDLSPFGILSFSINWPYVAAYIYQSQLQIRDTALENVHELLAGEALEFTNQTRHHIAVWEPQCHVEKDAIENSRTALDVLIESSAYAINAWASVYQRVILRLSGGFDSSVVLGLLNEAPRRPAITCVNEFSDSLRHNELCYARISARRAGMRLIEYRTDDQTAILDDRVFSYPRTPKPQAATIFGAWDRRRRNDLAEGLGAEAIWTGEGGDHLFLKTSSASSAVDFWRYHGPHLGLAAAIYDATKLSGMSYWSVLKQAVTTSRRHPDSRLGDPGANVPLVNPQSLPPNLHEYLEHPWSRHSGFAGKQLQIGQLSEVVNRHRPNPRFDYCDEHHPLLSQPLLEACLRIPTFVLLKGGRSRALARAAFEPYVSPEVLQREIKGASTGLITEIIRRSAPFLMRLLIDGILVRAGIVNQSELKRIIVERAPLRGDELWPLIACMSAEVWARNWSDASAMRPFSAGDR